MAIRGVRFSPATVSGTLAIPGRLDRKVARLLPSNDGMGLSKVGGSDLPRAESCIFQTFLFNANMDRRLSEIFQGLEELLENGAPEGRFCPS
jgi:hypothetical protein